MERSLPEQNVWRKTRELAIIASITKIINNRNSESSLISWTVFLHFPNQTSLICSPELVVLVPYGAPAARYISPLAG
jgi:hypothetical protein